MADKANKYPESVAGKFYVDDQCIDCDLCRETAPANFKRNDDGGHSYVYKQPENPDEEKLCTEAMEGCPVEAIGSEDPAVDAELIQLYGELLRRVGVTDYTLELNSIGDRNCRPAYLEQLSTWLDEHDAELDEEARTKRRTTPLRVFDVKS